MSDGKSRPLTLSECVDSFIFSPEDMKIISNEIAKNIQKHRKKYNITIDQLAHMTGLSKSSIYKAEMGKNMCGVSLESLLKISYVLQVPIQNFLPFMYNGKEKRQSLGETIDDITQGLPKDAKLFILNTVKTIVRYEVTRTHYNDKHNKH